MKTLKNLKRIYLIALTLFLAYSCSDDDPDNNEVATESIYDIAVNDPDSDYSIFIAAVNRVDGMETALRGASLSGSSEHYTVFAPDNSAFDQFLSDNAYADIDIVPVDVLTQLLRNHIIEGEVISSGMLREAGSGYLTTRAEESTTSNRINMLYQDVSGSLTLNGNAVVTDADNHAANGIVHFVDAVIDIPTVLTFMSNDPALNRLGDAVDLVSVDDPAYAEGFADFGAPAPYTIFAPGNDAIEELLANNLEGVTLEELQGEGDLESILNLHIITNVNALSSGFFDGMSMMTQNGEITFIVEGPTVFIIGPDELSTTNIVLSDIQAGNGIVHVLDTALLPL